MNNPEDKDGTQILIGFITIFGLVLPVIVFIWASTLKEVISIFK